MKRSRWQPLLWTGICFLILQLSLGAAVDGWLVGVRDPDYAAKAVKLRGCLARTPNRPLVWCWAVRALSSVCEPARWKSLSVPMVRLCSTLGFKALAHFESCSRCSDCLPRHQAGLRICRGAAAAVQPVPSPQPGRVVAERSTPQPGRDPPPCSLAQSSIALAA